MQIVTVNLPSVYITAIKKMTDERLYPSRSEAIRVAIRDFLKKELEMVEILLNIQDENEKKKPEKSSEKPKFDPGRKIDMRSIRRGWPEGKRR